MNKKKFLLSAIASLLVIGIGSSAGKEKASASTNTILNDDSFIIEMDEMEKAEFVDLELLDGTEPKIDKDEEIVDLLTVKNVFFNGLSGGQLVTFSGSGVRLHNGSIVEWSLVWSPRNAAEVGIYHLEDNKFYMTSVSSNIGSSKATARVPADGTYNFVFKNKGTQSLNVSGWRDM